MTHSLTSSPWLSVPTNACAPSTNPSRLSSPVSRVPARQSRPSSSSSTSRPSLPVARCPDRRLLLLPAIQASGARQEVLHLVACLAAPCQSWAHHGAVLLHAEEQAVHHEAVLLHVEEQAVHRELGAAHQLLHHEEVALLDRPATTTPASATAPQLVHPSYLVLVDRLSRAAEAVEAHHVECRAQALWWPPRVRRYPRQAVLLRAGHHQAPRSLACPVVRVAATSSTSRRSSMRVTR